jgi:hypothetical protein
MASRLRSGSLGIAEDADVDEAALDPSPRTLRAITPAIAVSDPSTTTAAIPATMSRVLLRAGAAWEACG